MNARQKDEQTLAILAMRSCKPPTYVARKFGLTVQYVDKTYRAIRDADIMHSEEEIQKIVLHYPKIRDKDK
jgi:hypothetical protein